MSNNFSPSVIIKLPGDYLRYCQGDKKTKTFRRYSQWKQENDLAVN